MSVDTTVQYAARRTGGYRPPDFGIVRRAALPLLLPALLLVLWQIASNRGWLAPQILPAPSVVFDTFIDLLRTGEIVAGLKISLWRISLGLTIGVFSGLALGVLLGVSEPARAYLEPVFRALFAIPTLGWIPILILVFGIEETLKIFIIAKAVLVPIVINTAEGIRNIPRSYHEVAETLRLRTSTRLFKLILPASLPTVFTGLRLAVSSAFVALIVVEMLAAAEGVGYMMTWGRTLFQIDIVIVGMIVVGIIGFALDTGLRHAERTISRWAPKNA